MTKMTLARPAKLLGPAMLATSLLTGCFSTMHYKPEGKYAKTLFDDEDVTKAVPHGEFTKLTVRYLGGGSYMTSGEVISERLIYRDKIVIKEARQLEPWSELDTPAFFAEVYEDYYWRDFLIHEVDGKPVVERIEQGTPGRDDTQRVATRGFNFGYPLRQGVRYFPRAMTPGFLLSVFPMKVSVLPQPVDLLKRLAANQLAAVSPDEKSFAYVDDMNAPSFVMVVDDNGERRDPIPIPRVELAPRPESDVNPYDRVRTWFNATYKWQRDSNGKWAAEPLAPVTPPAANPAEEIFLSERTGYRSCFTAADAHCLDNWHQASRDEVVKAIPYDPAQPMVYAPSVPTQAFGANVKLLAYETSSGIYSGYTLYSDSPPAQVMAEYAKRLESRRIPYVRSDQCTHKQWWPDCDDLIKSKLNIGPSNNRLRDLVIDAARGPATVFILPDMLVSLLTTKDGGTVMRTAYRGKLPH